MKKTFEKKQRMDCITLLPEDMIKHIADFLSYDDAQSLSQTCKQIYQGVLYEDLPHKCISSLTLGISNCDLDRKMLESGELRLSEALILNEIPLESESWINLIKLHCPNLKRLFIKLEYL
jgi:hypothetical protein